MSMALLARLLFVLHCTFNGFLCCNVDFWRNTFLPMRQCRCTRSFPLNTFGGYTSTSSFFVVCGVRTLNQMPSVLLRGRPFGARRDTSGSAAEAQRLATCSRAITGWPESGALPVRSNWPYCRAKRLFWRWRAFHHCHAARAETTANARKWHSAVLRQADVDLLSVARVA